MDWIRTLSFFVQESNLLFLEDVLDNKISWGKKALKRVDEPHGVAHP